MFRRAPSIRNIATSAVASLTAIGVLDTCIPLLLHAATSMLLYPAPLWQMNFKLLGRTSRSSSLKSPVNGLESLLRYRANTPSNSPSLHLLMKSARSPLGYSWSFDATWEICFHSFRVWASPPMRRAALSGILPRTYCGIDEVVCTRSEVWRGSKKREELKTSSHCSGNCSLLYAPAAIFYPAHPAPRRRL